MLQLHFIAVADWWTAAQTTDKHLYPLPGCKKTTKQQNIMGLSQCLLSNLQTSCKWRAAWELTECLTVVTCLCIRSKLQAVWFWCTAFITWRGCAPLFSTPVQLFSWRKPWCSAGMLPPIEVTCTMMLPDIFVQGKKSCTKSWDVLQNVLRMGKCLWVNSYSS